MKPALSMKDIIATHRKQWQDFTQTIGSLNQQLNLITKQRDALLEVCRNFLASDTQWQASFQFMCLERLLEEMKDVVTEESNDSTRRSNFVQS